MKKADLALKIAGVLGAVKVSLDAFGVHVITDADVNVIANGAAALIAVAAALRAVYVSRKK
ncbi:MAG TPA: hypothetical protein VEZ13_02010 [Brevibacillus sp.]|nr:hypothetical protein [Brevibacillus sp.]